MSVGRVAAATPCQPTPWVGVSKFIGATHAGYRGYSQVSSGTGAASLGDDVGFDAIVLGEPGKR